MITGHIRVPTPYEFPLILGKGLLFLKNLDVHSLEAGKIEIDGDNMFAEVVDTITHSIQDSQPESHKKYLDIHYLISGKEYIGAVIDVGGNPVSKPFVQGKDIQFYTSVEHETFIELFPGSYVILLPQDIHRPCCHLSEPINIRKVILKIAVDLL